MWGKLSHKKRVLDAASCPGPAGDARAKRSRCCWERGGSPLRRAVTDFPVFQGITLKLNDKQSCMVARIFHGGMIHRQGNSKGQPRPS